MVTVEGNAPCRNNPDLFFSNLKHHIREAQTLCAGCPLQDACKELGATEEYGTWGGETKQPVADWTPEKVIALMVTRSAGMSWGAIGDQLGIPGNSCRLKWRRLQESDTSELVAA